MNKSELIIKLADQHVDIQIKLIKCIIKEIIEYMSIALILGQRIEIRDFGSFSIRYRSSRLGRNPKTGKSLNFIKKRVIHFKPGKQLRKRINNT